MFKKAKISWEEIVSSYRRNPRDVKTIPLHKEGIWFYVSAENNNVYIERAKDHFNSSKIKKRASLEKEKVEKMLSLYYRRNQGEPVSQEAIDTTHYQVYWYGIFADMGL